MWTPPPLPAAHARAFFAILSSTRAAFAAFRSGQPCSPVQIGINRDAGCRKGKASRPARILTQSPLSPYSPASSKDFPSGRREWARNLHSLKAAVAATACKDQNHVAPLRTHRQGRPLRPPREPLEPQDQAQVPAEPRERDAPVRRAAALGAPAGVGERASHGRASRRARRLPGQSPGERAVAERARAQARPREEARRSLRFRAGASPPELYARAAARRRIGAGGSAGAASSSNSSASFSVITPPSSSASTIVTARR